MPVMVNNHGRVRGSTPYLPSPPVPRAKNLLPDGAAPSEFYAWQQDAACRDEDAQLFFGRDQERVTVKVRREAAALKVCRELCPVRRECLQHALSTPERHGVWGGLPEDELTAERDRRRRGRGWTLEQLLGGTEGVSS